MTYRIGKEFMVVLQTVMMGVKQVFYVPADNTERVSVFGKSKVAAPPYTYNGKEYGNSYSFFTVTITLCL